MNEISRLIKDNHTLMMILGCVAPMALLAAIFVFNVPLGTVGLFLVMLACPLMHVFMMKGMGHGDRHKGASCHGGTLPEESAAKANANLPTADAKQVWPMPTLELDRCHDHPANDTKEKDGDSKQGR